MLKVLGVFYFIELFANSLQIPVSVKGAHRAKELKEKVFGLQQSGCRSDTWIDWSPPNPWCASCTACNVTDMWGRQGLNISCQPCEGYPYSSGNRSIQVYNATSKTSATGVALNFLSDCNYWSGCLWNATCDFNLWNGKGYNCSKFVNQQNYTTCSFNTFYSWDTSRCSQCTACNTTNPYGTTTSWVDCNPCYNYTYRTYDRGIHNLNFTNYSSVDYIQRDFSTDCPTGWGTSDCNWCFTCVKSYGWSPLPGFNCDTCLAWNNTSNKTNTTCSSYIYNSYSWNNLPCGNCTSCSGLSSNGSNNSWVNCGPCYNYTWRTMDYSVHSYNQTNYTSQDYQQRYFSTDCSNGWSNCNWCYTCVKDYYNYFGFSCAECREWNNTNTTNTTNTTCKNRFYNNYSWSTGPCANCTECTTTSPSGSNTSNIECLPCVNYIWTYPDYTVHDSYAMNYSAPDGVQKYMTSDCSNGYNRDSCRWCYTCVRNVWDWFGYTCATCNEWKNNSNTTNTTNCYSQILNPYPWSSYPSANCTACNSTYGYNSSWVDCQPLYNYSWRTSDVNRYSYNTTNYSSTDYNQRFFGTDCGYNYTFGNASGCAWCYTCIKTPYSWFGFECAACQEWKNSSNTTNSTNCYSQILNPYPWSSYPSANCTACNSTSPYNSSWVECQPLYNYSWRTGDYARYSYNTTNYSSTDYNQRFFATDCAQNYTNGSSSSCAWCYTCTKSPYSWFGFECAACNEWKNNSNTTCYSLLLNQWSWSNYPGANCTSCNTSYGSSWIECQPLYNYTWRTSDVNRYSYNTTNISSYDYYQRYFGTDCGYNYTNGSASRCNWCYTCTSNKYNMFGYECAACNEWKSNSSLQCTSNIKNEYDWRTANYICSNCTHCNLTNGSYWANVTCKPCNNYTWTSTDVVQSQYYSNFSTPDRTDIYFTTECRNSSSCKWCVNCYKWSYSSFFYCSTCPTGGYPQLSRLATSRNITQDEVVRLGSITCRKCRKDSKSFYYCDICDYSAKQQNSLKCTKSAIVENKGTKSETCKTLISCKNGLKVQTSCKNFRESA